MKLPPGTTTPHLTISTPLYSLPPLLISTPTCIYQALYEQTSHTLPPLPFNVYLSTPTYIYQALYEHGQARPEIGQKLGQADENRGRIG